MLAGMAEINLAAATRAGKFAPFRVIAGMLLAARSGAEGRPNSIPD